MKEIIKPLKRYGGYSVSNLGNVYSSWTTGTKSHISDTKLKKLRAYKFTNGYMGVN